MQDRIITRVSKNSIPIVIVVGFLFFVFVLVDLKLHAESIFIIFQCVVI